MSNRLTLVNWRDKIAIYRDDELISYGPRVERAMAVIEALNYEIVSTLRVPDIFCHVEFDYSNDDWIPPKSLAILNSGLATYEQRVKTRRIEQLEAELKRLRES